MHVTFYSLKERIYRKQNQIRIRPKGQFVSTLGGVLLLGNFRTLAKKHNQYSLSCTIFLLHVDQVVSKCHT